MSRSLDVCEHGTASGHCSVCQHDHYTKTTILESHCPNCERLEDRLYHESRRADEVAYVKDGEIKALQAKLDKACAALEEYADMDHSMCITARTTLAEIRKKDE